MVGYYVFFVLRCDRNFIVWQQASCAPATGEFFVFCIVQYLYLLVVYLCGVFPWPLWFNYEDILQYVVSNTEQIEQSTILQNTRTGELT